MYKQIFNKTNGKPELIKSIEDGETGKKYFDYNESEYTTEIPPSNLYEPIYFENGRWIGATREEYLKRQPKVEIEELPDDKDTLIADLTLQLMETQNTVTNLQNDMASLTLQILESDINA
ncbi:hypothetical protein [Staphylococcus capitis]|uniref:hypothetical protein n=1 Tax=Staphylococcus capitis TaxID=29388 RepID=UPI001D158E14|nr:hypothetical protein [Staphylococcus capitis]MCC3755486.1 hypothetical protein [Staphylococcus capitis]MDH8729598.1 hypothetical protein [Staphylococcus capitis]MDH8729661.1 hypothetical protein [Staphylococcus capitis]MDH8923461.1 hypothetical protein [Staphylococcus capitis]MDH8944500.1 hypothetical protein [Staphylococcus capitis]